MNTPQEKTADLSASALRGLILDFEQGSDSGMSSTDKVIMCILQAAVDTVIEWVFGK